MIHRCLSLPRFSGLLLCNIIRKTGKTMGIDPQRRCLIFASLAGATGLARAQPGKDDPLYYARTPHLGYIRHSSDAINKNSQAGLESLAAALTKRMNINRMNVVGLTPESKILPLVPFLYWPVTSDAQPLSRDASAAIQKYLNTRGTIVFDFSDKTALQRLLENVPLRPLVEITANHALARTTYLRSNLSPGTPHYRPVWVESGSDCNSRGVSSIIMGSSRWASAWAGAGAVKNSPEYEAALQSGINMVMYALTGNYKCAPSHAPLIQERLDSK